MQLLNTLVTVQFIATSITVLCCLVVIDQSLLVHAASSPNVRAAPTMIGFLMSTPSVSNYVALKWRAHPTELARRHGGVAQEAEKETVMATKTSVINVTTVVIAASSNGSHDTSYRQEQLDPNQENTFEDQLQDDQEALHRIALILGLVGGIGGVAIVAGIVIYTKMRLRKKHDIENESQRESISGYSASYLSHDLSDATSGGDQQEVQEREEEEEEEEEDNSETPLPSAPPAPLLPSDLLFFPDQRKHLEPSSCGNPTEFSQDTPGPSAPPAKEIDSANREACTIPFMYHLQLDEASCSSCPQCHNTESLSPALLEVPPPAYTPSAPPLDALLQLGSLSSISHASSSSHIGNSDDILLLSPSRSSSQRNGPSS